MEKNVNTGCEGRRYLYFNDGVAIMSLHKGLRLETALESDSAALNGLLAAMREDLHGGERVIDWLRGEQLPRVC